MANAWYPSGLDAVAGSVDLSVDQIKVALVDGYTYSSAHTAYTDVSAYVVGTPVAITGQAVSGGYLNCDDVVFSSVAGGSTVDGYVIYHNDSSALLGYCDTKADTTPISVTTDGGSITLDLDGGHLLKI